MATRSGDPFLKNGIFQLEDDIIALQASDKQPEIAGEKVYSYNYALGIQEPDFGGDVGDDDDDDEDEDDDDDDRGQAAPAVELSAAGERQKMLTPVEHLNLDEIDDKLDPQYFPLNGHESQSLRVLEYEACAPAQRLLDSVDKNLQFPGNSAAELLDLSSPETPTPFITGVRIRGKHDDEGKSTFFVSVPYLGKYEHGRDLQESVGLAEFGDIGDALPPNVVVHQAWFLVFGNGTVATFKSKESVDNGSSPKMGQIRYGAFHVLAHMIAGVLRSDKRILDEFLAQCNNNRCYLQAERTRIGPDPSSVIDLGEGVMTVEGRARVKRASRELEAVTAAMSVIRRQIRLLNNLAKLLLSSSGSIVYPSSSMEDNRRFEKSGNIVEIPVISKQTEQLPYALYVIEQAAKQRSEDLKELEEMVGQTKMAYDGLIQLVSPAFAILETSRRMESTGKDRGKQVDETTPSPSDTPQTAETGPAQPQNQSSGTNNGRQEPKEKESVLLLDILVHLRKDAEEQARAREQQQKLLDQILAQLKADAMARDSQLKEQYEIMVTQSQSIVERNNEAGHEAQYLLGQLEVQGETIAWQADTMSWFTLITFIFLPLAFFTQYFALDGMKYHTKTEVEFWKIVGPAAVIMGFLVFLIVIYKKYGHKELVAAYRERRLPKERKPDLDRGKEKGKGVKGEAEKEKAGRREEGERKREEENEKDTGETDEKNRNSMLSGATTMMSSSAALSMSQTTTSPAAQATKTMTTSPVAQTTTPSTPQAPARTMTQTAAISISRTTAPSTSYAMSSSAAAPPTPPAPVFPGTFRPTSTTVDGDPELLPPARKQSLFGDWWNKYLRSRSQAESHSLV